MSKLQQEGACLTEVVCTEGTRNSSRSRRSKRCNMAASQIDDMDEVADCSAVWSFPVRSEDFQHRPRSCEHRCNHWDKIGRLLSRVFPEKARFVAADLRMLLIATVREEQITYWIEVSERRYRPGRIRPGNVRKY